MSRTTDITIIITESMRPKRPDSKLPLPYRTQVLALTHHPDHTKASRRLTTFCFTASYHPEAQSTRLPNPTSTPMGPQRVTLLNIMQRTKAKLMLCFLWKQNGISLGLLIRPYCHLNTLLLQRRIPLLSRNYSVPCLTQSLKRADWHSQTRPQRAVLTDFCLSPTVNLTVARKSISFLFDFSRRTERAGRQLQPRREETATQKPFHQHIYELPPGPPTSIYKFLLPGTLDPAPSQVSGPRTVDHTSNSHCDRRIVIPREPTDTLLILFPVVRERAPGKSRGPCSMPNILLSVEKGCFKTCINN